ncbi:MAG: MltA domain-containing protein [Pseudomonadota bacterium]
MIRRIAVILTLGLLLAACKSSSPPPQTDVYSAPIEPVLEPRWQVPPRPLAYNVLPGWDTADLAPGLNALRRSCAAFAGKGSGAYISSRQVWAGRVSDWLPACEALSVIADANSARAVIQALFVPVEVQSNTGDTRFTGYFEPEYEARLYPQAPFTEPVLAKPSDLVVQGGKVYQRQRSGRLRPYPKRAEITRRPTGQVLAYMRPGDLFFLQIQGSGRLTLAGGRTIRAVYAANNGHAFKSTANWLMRKRWITRGQASMTGIRAWMASAPERRVREAMNANPRYIFFATLPEGDQILLTNGSLGVPLTPLGSV